MQSIMVTGATSMVGSAIVAEALRQNKKVGAVIRKNSPQLKNLAALDKSQNFKIYEADINDYENLKPDEKYDAFIHLAWQNTEHSKRDCLKPHIDNIAYTIDAVKAAKRAGCKIFINAGSQAEYGCGQEKLRGDSPCNPESGYGIAKYAAGKMALIAAENEGMKYCHTRILSTYGPGMKDNTLVMYLIKTLLNNEKPLLTACGQMWDYMYVSDTARAFLAIAEKGMHGKIYPLGSDHPKRLKEYVEIIRAIVNPLMELGFGEKEYYPHQPMYLCADITELRENTGFEPAIDFADGVKMLVDWVRANEKKG